MSDRWDGRQAGFGVSDGEWWARIVPVSNDPNLVGVRQDVVVITPAALAEVERAAAATALTDLATKIEATSKRTDNTFTEHAVVEAGGLELLREAAAAYRREETE